MITIRTTTRITNITRKIITKLCFAAVLVTLIYSCVSLPYKEGTADGLIPVGATPPIAPKNVRVENESYFSAIIAWDPIDSGDLGRRIDQKPASLSYYEVEYSENSGFSKSKIFASNENIFTLKDLRAGARYYVRVRAINDNGTPKNTSKKSVIKGDFFSTPSIPKIMPPQNIRGAVSDLYIDLTWDRPKSTGPSVDNTRQVALKSYLVRIFEKDGSTTAPTQIVISGSLLAYRLSTSIGPNTTYEIAIASKNELDEVSKFASITALTIDYITEPPAPVTNLSSKPNPNTDNNYIISWTPPTSLGKKNSQIAAQIKAYEVYYSEDEFFPDNLTDVKTVSPSETTTEISLSRGSTNYYIKVLVRNNAGAEGLVSSPVKIQVLTEAKATAPSAPELDKRPAIDSKNINLSWSLPFRTGNSAYGEVNKGKIETYTVEYTRKSADNFFKSAPEGSEVVVVTAATASLPESRKLAILLDNLRGDTVYLFRVYATNNYDKKSHPSNTIEVNIPPNTKGPEKITGLSFSKIPGKRGINLKWDKITRFGTKTDGITPASTVAKYRFKVYEKSGDLTLLTPVFQDDFQASAEQEKAINYSGKGLKPLKDYRIVLIAINEVSGVSEPSDPLVFGTVDTLEAPPGGVTDITTDDKKYNTDTGVGIEISWTPPTDHGRDDFGNEKIPSTMVYTMNYTKESTGTGANISGDFSDKTKYEAHENIPNTKASFSSLLGATTYYVQIITTNDNSVHAKSSPVEYRFTTPSRGTKPNVIAPTSVETRKDPAGTAVIEFKWELPTEGSFGKATDGIGYATISPLADAYTIRYSKVISDFQQVSDFTSFDQLALRNLSNRGKQTFDKLKTKWTIQGLTPGTKYYYLMTIKSSNSLTTKHLGNTETISVSTPPLTITATSIDKTLTNGELKITWDKPNSNFGTLKDDTSAQLADITSYRIYYKSPSDTSYTAYITEVDSSSPRELIISRLKTYTQYRVFISPKNKDSEYSDSPPAGITSGRTKSGATKPDVPKRFQISTISSPPTKSSIGVVWSHIFVAYGLAKDGTTRNTTIQYVLEYKKGLVTSWSDKSVVSVVLLASALNSHTVNRLDSDTTYNFRLQAVNVDDNSKKSDFTLATSKTLSGATSPAAPGNLRLTLGNPTNPNPSSREVTLEWNPSTSNGFNKTGKIAAQSPRYFLKYREKTTKPWTSTTPPETRTNYTISGLNPFIEYEFVVKAQNSSDSSKVSDDSTTLEVKTLSASTKPSPPQNIKESTTTSPTSTSITISWSDARDKGKDQFGIDNTKIRYTIEYKKNLDVWTAGATSIPNIEGDVSGTNSRTISGLDSYTAYDFRIKSINYSDKTMDSSFANPLSLSTTSGATAPSIPQNLSENITKTTTTAIGITWTASTILGLKKDGKTDASVKYIVEYKKDDKTTTWKDDATTVTTTTTSLLVTGLTPGTNYSFRIKAQNADDSSKESVFLGSVLATYTNSAATAPGSPTDVQAEDKKTTTTSITISWTASAKYGLNKQGQTNTTPPEYTFQFRKTSGGGIGWTGTSGITATSYKMENLPPDTEYDVRVQAANGTDTAKISGFTTQLTFRTLEASTSPDAPTKIISTGTDITSTSIKIHWTEPKDYGDDKSGKLNTVAPKYTVSYKEGTTPSSTWIETARFRSISANEYQWSKLKPDTDYSFKIVAENVDDSSKKSSPLEGSFKTLSGATAPSVPKNVILSTTTPATKTSLSITWEKPNSNGKNRLNTADAAEPKYVIQYKEKTALAAAWAANTSSAQTGKTFTAAPLKPGTEYIFRVKAINAEDDTKKSAYTNSTGTLITRSGATAPSSPRSLTADRTATNQVSVVWNRSLLFGLEADGATLAAAPSYRIRYKKKSDAGWTEIPTVILATTTSYISPASLKPFTEYEIQVKSVHASVGSLSSAYTASLNIKTLSAATAPGVPQNLRLNPAKPATPTSLSIMWDAPISFGTDDFGNTIPTTGLSYQISYRVGSSIRTVGSVKNPLDINGLPANTSHTFTITAATAGGQRSSQVTRTFSTTSGAKAPDIPTKLEEKFKLANRIGVGWTAPVLPGTNADGTTASAPSYNIRYRKASSTDSRDWITVAVSAPTTPGIITHTTPPSSLLSLTAYVFQVQSVHASVSGMVSAYTASLQISTTSGATPPDAPTDIIIAGASGRKTTSLEITWSAFGSYGTDNSGDPITDFPSYEVSYRVEGSPESTNITMTTISGSTYLKAEPLIANTSYTFTVYAINSAGKKSLTAATQNLSTLSAATPPDAPINLTSSAVTTTQITIQWDAPAFGNYGTDSSGAKITTLSKYEILYLGGGATKTIQITTVTRSYDITGLAANTAYGFNVYAINSAGKKSLASANNFFTTTSPVTPPGLPQGFQKAFGALANNKIGVFWGPPVSTSYGTEADGVTPASFPSYNIRYKEQSASRWTTVAIPVGGSVLGTYAYETPSNLKPFTTYEFQIQSVNNKDSNIYSVYTPTPPLTITTSRATAPSVPRSLTVVTPIGVNKIRVFWGSPTLSGTNADGTTASAPSYNIRYKEQSASGWTTPSLPILGRVSVSTYTYETPPNLKPSTTYEFQVQSVNNKDSNIKSLYTPTSPLTITTASPAIPPGVPTAMSGSEIKAGQIIVLWNAPDPLFYGKNADGSSAGRPSYNIHYRESGAANWIGPSVIDHTTGASFPTSISYFFQTPQNLKPSTTYEFQVQSVNPNDSNIYSAYEPTTPFVFTTK